MNTESQEVVRMVADLLDQVSGTAVSECEFSSGGFHILLRRSPSFVPRVAESNTAQEEIPEHWQAVVSPLTGIFYASETPQTPPFVSVGSMVDIGQVIGLIEAMKTFNRVEIELSGTVRAIVVANGDEVQAGQTLLYLEPAGDV